MRMLNVKQDKVGHKGLLFAKFGPEDVNKHRLQKHPGDASNGSDRKCLSRTLRGYSHMCVLSLPVCEHACVYPFKVPLTHILLPLTFDHTEANLRLTLNATCKSWLSKKNH